MACPICNCEEASELGSLGNITYVRCCACGTDYSLEEIE